MAKYRKMQTHVFELDEEERYLMRDIMFYILKNRESFSMDHVQVATALINISSDIPVNP